jgi:putative endonuclease
MEEYVVYVLYSERFDRLYIGYSGDVILRFKFHNELAKKGFTIRYRPWKVIVVEFYSSKKQAMVREKELKGGQGRSWIRNQVIKNMQSAGFISA